jgi:hypothetical protein
MLLPKSVSLRPIGKIGLKGDIYSRNVWHDNVSMGDIAREREYQRAILRKKHPLYSIAEIETILERVFRYR